jgi:hypothetical protein
MRLLIRKFRLGWCANLLLSAATFSFLFAAVGELLKAEQLRVAAVALAVGIAVGRLAAEVGLCESLKEHASPRHHLGLFALLYAPFLFASILCASFGVYVRIVDGAVITAEQIRADRMTWDVRRQTFAAQQAQIVLALEGILKGATSALSQATDDDERRILRRNAAEVRNLLHDVKGVEVPLEPDPNQISEISDRLFMQLTRFREAGGAAVQADVPLLNPPPRTEVAVSSPLSRFLVGIREGNYAARACVMIAFATEILALLALLTTIRGFRFAQFWWRSRDALHGFFHRSIDSTIRFLAKRNDLRTDLIGVFKVTGELPEAERDVIFEQIRRTSGIPNPIFTTCTGTIIELDQPLLRQLRRDGADTVILIDADSIVADWSTQEEVRPHD